ncbi:HD domain-containing phosphohydrolase [Oceanidesulfovibrio marinus]|nr:HD domain-containing phosphohydrolase [Oceanidesulfovibrio marinus]
MSVTVFPSAANEQPTARQQPERASLLIVEDSSTLALYLEQFFEAEGYTILGVYDTAEEALINMRRLSATGCEPDGVLMDIVLAGEMDGVEAARVILQRYKSAVVFLTGLRDVDRAVDVQPHAYLSKPFEMHQARAVLRIALQHRRLENELKRKQEELEALNATLEQRVQERSEELLRVEREKNAVLSGLKDVVVFSLSPDMDILWTNAPRSMFPEVAGGAITGAQYDKLFKSNNGSANGNVVKRALESCAPAEGEVVTMDGRSWFAHCNPLFDRYGHVTRLVQVMMDISERKRSHQEMEKLHYSLAEAHGELMEAYRHTIEGWARALELKDKETEGHSRRVVNMTLELARALGIEGEELTHIEHGAILHDIGKMGVPDDILLKPGKLNDEEWMTMRRHPEYAHEWLSAVPYLQPAMTIPYCHHERWDGKGYPQGLSGEDIPFAARIFAVVDVWDALISDRPYRQAWPTEKATAYIREQSGKQFDPRVVEAFFEYDIPRIASNSAARVVELQRHCAGPF